MKMMAATLLLAFALFGAKSHNWQAGTLLDTKTAKTYVQTGSSTQANGTATTTGTASAGAFNATTSRSGASETQIHGMALEESQLLIVTKDFLFIISDTVERGRGLYGSLSRAIDNHKHGCHVIVGDPIDFYQEKTTIYVADVDGKECKMDLIRQERIAKPAAKP